VAIEEVLPFCLGYSSPIMASARPSKRPISSEDNDNFVVEFASPEEEEMALRYAKISKLAELKASTRESRHDHDQQMKNPSTSTEKEKPTFLTKAERQAAALAR